MVIPIIRLQPFYYLQENKDLAEFMKSDDINLLWNLADVDQVRSSQARHYQATVDNKLVGFFFLILGSEEPSN